jgi:hypothetical protein
MAKTVVRQFSDEELNQLFENIVQENSKNVIEATGRLLTNKELTTHIQGLQTTIVKSAAELLKKQEQLYASKADINSSTNVIQKAIVDLLKKLTTEQASKTDLDKTSSELLKKQEKWFASKADVNGNTAAIQKNITDLLTKLSTELTSKTDLDKTATESLKKQEKLFASKADANNHAGLIQQAISDTNKYISEQISSVSKSSDKIVLTSLEHNLNKVMETLLEKFVTMPEMDKKHDELKTEVGMILEANKGKLRSEFRTVVEANNEAIRAEFKGLLEANNKRLVQDISEQLVDSLESIIEKNLQKKVKETLANVKLKID